MRLVSLVFLLYLIPGQAAAGNVFDKLMSLENSAYRIIGKGFVTDASHPWHPGDFRKYDVLLTLMINPELGETALEFEWVDNGDTNKEIYYVRRGRIFQVNDSGEEKYAESFGDVSAATVETLHPTMVANAILERRENLEPDHADGYLFAWKDELWSMSLDGQSGKITSLHRRVYSDLYGDGTEDVRYTNWPEGVAGQFAGSVTVSLRGREIAHFEFGAIERGIQMSMPAGDRQRDRTRLVAASEITFKELAPHLFSIDVDSINTRVMVAEFYDYLVVLEGAYNSRNCDLLARIVPEHFQKPVSFFAFSHIHGQYVGGTRSWVQEGAVIIEPPSTIPLIEEIVKSHHDLRPDALTLEPKPLQITTVKEKRRIDDEVNAMEIYNVASDHTDEYFIFYFPRQKVLLTGDLLFYRPGQPLTGRSKKLCDTIAKLGLDVETYVCTWPLAGYGTKNIVSKTEMLEACSGGR